MAGSLTGTYSSRVTDSGSLTGPTQTVSTVDAPAGRRLLFGEVPPTTSPGQAAGYGIQSAHRRRGSEGSPMHTPNPMFPSDEMATGSQMGPVSEKVWQSRPSAPFSPPNGHSPARPGHRRAVSDFSTPSEITVRLNASVAPGAHDNSSASRSGRKVAVDLDRKQAIQSRIPVSTRRYSLASGSDSLSPTSRTATLGLPSKAPAAVTGSDNGKSPGPRREAHSPMHIKSPGRRGRGPVIPPGEKSPSLRANIIAPPPKISPPLRSSRPRLPVSSATTAASRAKMAEKFTTMAKQQSDKQSALRRQRPPELMDIDLKARRLRITQVLSRSREGDDLTGQSQSRPGSTSRTNSTTPSVEEVSSSQRKTRPQGDVPAVVVDEVRAEKNQQHEFQNSSKELAAQKSIPTQSPLQSIEHDQSHRPKGPDSPTLGHAERPLSSLRLPIEMALRAIGTYHDPKSAATEGTVDTEGTMIEPEPQADAAPVHTAGHSLLSQISSLRSHSSASPLSRTLPGEGDVSDHADQESVQLMLRNTTYLDEDEAIEKGYRDFAPPPVPSTLYPPSNNDRDSWTSSIEDQMDVGPDATETGRPPSSPRQADRGDMDVGRASQEIDGRETPIRSTMASDAYTIVNIVLQQRSASGVVDQQVVDDIYQRIVDDSPYLATAEVVDAQRIEKLCLQELADYQNDSGGGSAFFYHSTSADQDTSRPFQQDDDEPHQDDRAQEAGIQPHDTPTPPSYRSHRYKSSLDSAEDWADTSPSVGDWIKYRLDRSEEAEHLHEPSSLSREVFLAQRAQSPGLEPGHQFVHDDSKAEEAAIPRPPSHSPPPPPKDVLPSIERQASWIGQREARAAMIQPPEVPGRSTSRPQVSSPPQDADQQEVPAASAGAVESAVDEQVSQEQRRLKQRRHVLKELVDTEYTYEKDLRVLCDIYKQTATFALGDEDIKILFGNVELVQQFSRDFLGLLKQVVKPAYIMERPDRRKDGSNRASNLQRMSSAPLGMTDAEKDECTQVGRAFEVSLADMEQVYTDYIRTRHAANKKLEALQTSPAVREWLKECSDNSSDITNAWSLDALLVKPVQRITKYPLLLKELLDVTPESHPDSECLRKAAMEVTEVNVRINEVKKHTELVDQVFSRKRKESDVRNGLTKAFGRRAEKLRQHVGINEMYEDNEYARLKIEFDNNIVHLLLVSKDCHGYIDSLRAWVVRMCDVAAAAEAWVDVGHTSYAQAESKLRQFAMVIKGISSIALPDHSDQVVKRVIQPMEKTAALLDKFKSDTKGLIQKREKRLLDYNQVRNKKDKGEKLDKKMTERMEQWEALNLEAKARMKKLLRSTADLVHSCQANLVHLHLSWLSMCKQKLSAAMDISLDALDVADILREWQVDFDYQEASALSLGICNGALLAEAVNMFSFAPAGSILNGEDSPRQLSWTSGTKRSISINEEATHAVLPPVDYLKRHSGGPSSSQGDDPSDRSSLTFVNGRLRTASAASGRMPKTPETHGRSAASLSVQTTSSANFSRPGTSLGRAEDNTNNTGRPPRLSVDTPSPSFGPLISDSPAAGRPPSSSTFYSATPGPSHSGPQQATTAAARSSIFSSAMPMSDSPEEERQQEPEPGPRQEPDVLFTAASVYEFNIDRSRQQGGFQYLTYVTGEIFDVIAEHGELWLAINQDDPARQIGWIWNKHFAKLAE